MFKLKIKITILLLAFITFVPVLLKIVQSLKWYTYNLEVFQVVYLFPATVITSYAIALTFQYIRGLKSILLYSVFVATNYLYIFFNSEILLLNTNQYFYLAIAIALLYSVIYTFLLVFIYKYGSSMKECEEKITSEIYINQTLNYLNASIIFICLLSYAALILAILFRITLFIVVIGMVILFFIVFILNFIKYRLVLSVMQLKYSRVVIVDSLSIVVGMQLNFILCRYIFNDGFPVGVAVIIFTLSLCPVLATNKRIQNFNKLKVK